MVCAGAEKISRRRDVKLAGEGSVRCEAADFEELAVQLLGAGRAVRFRARGSSMQPMVRDGDVLDVWPADSVSIDVGDIILYRSIRKGIVVHRVVGMYRQDENTTLVVKGDSVRTADPEVHESQVLGRIVSIERRGRKIAAPTRFWRHRSSLHLRLLPLRRRANAVLQGALRELRSISVGGGCQS